MLFIDNKYTIIYYKIIERAKQRNHIKQKYDGYQTHHIIPRCFGGTNDTTNLVVLTYKEHRVCHRLLINMTESDSRYRMMYAYKLFNKEYDISWIPPFREYKPESYTKMVETRKSRGSYKTGKENNFSKPEIIEQVKQRMIDNNPMKAPEQRQRMSLRNNNPNVRPIVVEGITFPTIGAAARYFGISPYLLKKRYNYRLLDS
jgi:AraC-like DNA-binding protein